MPSEQGPIQNIQARNQVLPNNQNSQALAAAVQTPNTAVVKNENVLGAMRDAETPLDFIKNNLKPRVQETVANAVPQPDINPQVMSEEAGRKAAEAGTPQVPSIPQNPLPAAAKPGEPLPTDKKADPLDVKYTEDTKVSGGAAIGDEDDGLDIPNAPVKENFKKLRTKLKETTKTLTEIQTQFTNAQKELEGYKTGSVAPEVILEKEAEVARLSKYEKLFNFKGSKEYQRQFGAPLKNIHDKIKGIATDYNVPHEVIEKGLKLKGPELDDFLTDHFTQLSALEVKQLVGEAQKVEDAARAAEGDPEKALSSLAAENQAIAEEEDHSRKVHIAETSRDSWNAALNSVREEGLASELIMNDNDPEFNEKFVKPTLTRAATEYGKIIRELADAGLQYLSPTLAKALAKMTQYGHAAPIAIQSREIAVKQLNEIMNNTKRSNGYMRPGIGGSGNGLPSGSPQRGPVDANAASEAILNKVMGSR